MTKSKREYESGAEKKPPGSGGAHWLERRENRNRSHFARRPSRRERDREAVLTDWFGPDRAPAEIEALRPPARLAGSVIEEVFENLGMSEGVVLDKLKAAWGGMVGVDGARRSRPIALQHGVLRVEVDNSTWLVQLRQEHYAHVLEAVRHMTGNKVRDLRFVVAGRYAPVPPRPPGE